MSGYQFQVKLRDSVDPLFYIQTPSIPARGTILIDSSPGGEMAYSVNRVALVMNTFYRLEMEPDEDGEAPELPWTHFGILWVDKSPEAITNLRQDQAS